MNSTHTSFPIISLPLAVAFGLLAGCSAPTPTPAGAGPGPAIRMEQFCDTPGLPRPLRETYVVVDSLKLKRAETPADFADRNADARSAVLAVGNPSSSVDQGLSAARERITLLLTSADGAAPRQLFTGCLPALSAADRADLASTESAASTFFTGGQEQKIREAGDQFRTALIGSLIATARAQPEALAADGTAFLQSLASSSIVFGGKQESVPRIIFVTDAFAAMDGVDTMTARKAGFERAKELGVKLGFSEVAIVGNGSESEAGREGARSMLLAMDGALGSWTKDGGSIRSAAVPIQIRRFAGAVTYPISPPLEEIVHVRLGLDANGQLTNSWMIEIGEYRTGVPMQGIGTCTTEDRCELRSDASSTFAQLWVPERKGNEPHFDDKSTAPYAALRQWKLTVIAGQLQGEIFDPAVDQIGENPQARALSVKATLQPNANF